MSESQLAMRSDSAECIAMTSGALVNPTSLDPREVMTLDIAQALSNLCRFGGHCRHFYSVAQHSVLVSLLVDQQDKDLAFFALLHDAAEAYLGDMCRPLKHREEMTVFRDWEDRALRSVYLAVGLPIEPSPEQQRSISDADNAMLRLEASLLMPYGDWWERSDDEKVVLPPAYRLVRRRDFWSPMRARREFIRRFVELQCR